MQHHEVHADTLTQNEQTQLQEGIQLVKQRLQNQASQKNQPILIRQLHRQLELLNEHAQCAGNFACKSGCASCCDKPKQVSLIELHYIVSQLRHVPREQRLQWQARIATIQQEQSTACPFLSTSSACEIYPLRPAVCRKAHSYSATACHTDQAAIPQHLGLLMQAEALILGTQLAIQEQNGVHTNPTLDFNAGLHQLLNVD